MKRSKCRLCDLRGIFALFEFKKEDMGNAQNFYLVEKYLCKSQENAEDPDPEPQRDHL